MSKRLREISEKLGEINSNLERINNQMALWLAQTEQLQQTLSAFQDDDTDVLPALPPDFPHRDLLHDAGYTSVAAIPRTVKQLRKIPGIEWDEALAIDHAMRKEHVSI